MEANLDRIEWCRQLHGSMLTSLIFNYASPSFFFPWFIEYFYFKIMFTSSPSLLILTEKNLIGRVY